MPWYEFFPALALLAFAGGAVTDTVSDKYHLFDQETALPPSIQSIEDLDRYMKPRRRLALQPNDIKVSFVRWIRISSNNVRCTPTASGCVLQYIAAISR